MLTSTLPLLTHAVCLSLSLSLIFFTSWHLAQDVLGSDPGSGVSQHMQAAAVRLWVAGHIRASISVSGEGGCNTQ